MTIWALGQISFSIVLFIIFISATPMLLWILFFTTKWRGRHLILKQWNRDFLGTINLFLTLSALLKNVDTNCVGIMFFWGRRKYFSDVFSGDNVRINSTYVCTWRQICMLCIYIVYIHYICMFTSILLFRTQNICFFADKI